MTSDSQILKIRSGQGEYPVEIGSSIQYALHQLETVKNGFAVMDRNLDRLYPELSPSIKKRFHLLLLDATEDEKTLTGVAKVSTFLQENGANKQSTLIALGGGIIQDICAFSSHIYYRGLPWIFVPTTLLSMSDSCIGAKCGINLNAFKNQLGFFHSPSRVLIATDFLKTLSQNDVASGYGEILKLMLTGSESAFETLEHSLQSSKGLLLNSDLPELIRQSLEIKRKIIEEDEYERDLRRILNYGHTFGHALESLTEYQVPHGLGVAWGLDLINFLSWKRGLLSEAWFKRVHELILKYFPFQISKNLTAHDLIQGAKRDKKVSDGQVNLVLLEKGPGGLKIIKTAFDDRLAKELQAYLEFPHVFAKRTS